MALLRRDRPPAALLAQLDKGERVVSWADTAETVVAATPRGVWWPSGAGHRLIEWQHIDKATWRDGVLTITEAEVLDDTLLVERPPVSVAVTTPRDLPPTIRKRVEANIVRRELAAVAGGSVRFVARRQPGRDGVVWWARLEPGTPDSAPTRSAVRARLERLRAQEEPRRPDPDAD